MKSYNFIHVLVAVVLFFTACNDDFLEQPKTPAADGSEIIFGGRAGFENNGKDTRTVYTGVTYEYNGKKYERIDWIDGDKIEIYSEDASNGPSAHYNITSLTTGDENAGNTNKGSDYAYLERQGESSLRWNGDGDHTFYAMYPSTSMFVREDGSITTVEQGIKLDKSEDNIVVKGTVPTSQSGTITESNGNYTIDPNMNYAYMVARTTANRLENPHVGLSFVPIVTAVEIEMIVPENTDKDVHDVLIAEIQVTGNGIAGDFTADLTSWATGYPTCVNVGDGQGTIQISTWLDGQPLKLTEGKSVKFTVFMRPGAEYRDLTISYSPTGSGYIRKNLYGKDSNGNSTDAVVIPQNLKTRIKKLHLPATYDKPIEVDASRWMDQIADEVEFKALSIPGTGGTFSYDYNDEDYMQQTLNFEQQWKVGVRAFEVISDRPRYGTTSLGTEDVKCNKTSMGQTVSDVLTKLINKVSETTEGKFTETAVLILTYQPEGAYDGWSQRARNADLYAESLNLMMSNLTTEQKKHIVQYTPSMTLGQARGNVMIFCRINQRDEREDGSFDGAKAKLTDACAQKVILIDGCGTGKDRWGARGYEVKGNDDWNLAYDAAHTDDSDKSVDYWMGFDRSGSYWDGYTYTARDYANNVRRGNSNYLYDTNVTNVDCWYQEWARVVNLEHLGVQNANYYERSNDVRWYESYNEKVSAAKETFEVAVRGSYPSYIFINSLCGYLVDSSISSSYTQFTGSNTGGIAGNIKALADKINVDFYQYVLNSGFEQMTGPTGIVMMDYVKSTPETDTDGGYYLPGVIISNNFKGNLQTKPDGGTTGGGNTGGGSGTGSDEGEEEEG